MYVLYRKENNSFLHNTSFDGESSWHLCEDLEEAMRFTSPERALSMSNHCGVGYFAVHELVTHHYSISVPINGLWKDVEFFVMTSDASIFEKGDIVEAKSPYLAECNEGIYFQKAGSCGDAFFVKLGNFAPLHPDYEPNIEQE